MDTKTSLNKQPSEDNPWLPLASLLFPSHFPTVHPPKTPHRFPCCHFSTNLSPFVKMGHRFLSLAAASGLALRLRSPLRHMKNTSIAVRFSPFSLCGWFNLQLAVRTHRRAEGQKPRKNPG